jgi:hypothetical protein
MPITSKTEATVSFLGKRNMKTMLTRFCYKFIHAQKKPADNTCPCGLFNYRFLLPALFFSSDVYPNKTGTLLEAQNPPETRGAQKLKLENTSIKENIQPTPKPRKTKL